MKMAGSTKTLLSVYQITWCHSVNLDETIIQTVLPCRNIAAKTEEKQVCQILCRERLESVTVCETMKTKAVWFLHQKHVFIGLSSGTLVLAIKPGWMTATLFSTVSNHIWQHIHHCQHNPFQCYFISTRIISPLYQYGLLQVIAF